MMFLGNAVSAGTFAVVALMVGESINKVLANYPDVEAACHIYMSSSDATTGLLNSTNATFSGCTTMDGCREVCQAATTSIAITIAFVTGVIMVRSRGYIHTDVCVRSYVCTYVCT